MDVPSHHTVLAVVTAFVRLHYVIPREARNLIPEYMCLDSQSMYHRSRGAMLVLVFCVFVFFTNAQVSPSSCNEDSCWRPPAAVLPESEGVSEGEAIETLLCSLACEDSTAEVRGWRRS